jgi:AraC-like DNA-binding protein
MTWQGSAFLGIGWAAFRGVSAGNSAHAHPALQIALSRKQAVTVTGQHVTVTGKAIVVAPNVIHSLKPADEVTLILIEPQTRLANYFCDHLSSDMISLLGKQETAQINLDGPIHTCLDDILKTLPSATLSVDRRLEKALALLQQDDERKTIEEVAQQVGLSTARLRVVAKRDLGVSLSDWMIWRRLERASRFLSLGSTIASAAYGAGFADQSHFARAMRSHFGITAKMISSLMN